MNGGCSIFVLCQKLLLRLSCLLRFKRVLLTKMKNLWLTRQVFFCLFLFLFLRSIVLILHKVVEELKMPSHSFKFISTGTGTLYRERIMIKRKMILQGRQAGRQASMQACKQGIHICQLISVCLRYGLIFILSWQMMTF